MTSITGTAQRSSLRIVARMKSILIDLRRVLIHQLNLDRFHPRRDGSALPFGIGWACAMPRDIARFVADEIADA
jgi:hypothetical protein